MIAFKGNVMGWSVLGAISDVMEYKFGINNILCAVLNTTLNTKCMMLCVLVVCVYMCVVCVHVCVRVCVLCVCTCVCVVYVQCGMYVCIRMCVYVYIVYIIMQAVTDSGLLMITQHCHQLQQLNISGCDQLTDLSLRHLGTGCPQLR